MLACPLEKRPHLFGCLAIWLEFQGRPAVNDGMRVCDTDEENVRTNLGALRFEPLPRLFRNGAADWSGVEYNEGRFLCDGG
jgi:hypothetical protein